MSLRQGCGVGPDAAPVKRPRGESHLWSPLRYLHPSAAAIVAYVVYEWSRGGGNSPRDPVLYSHEQTHFVPRRKAGPRQIEASGAVLFDGRTFSQDRMKLSVVAKDNPALCGHLR
jgi:hypothetical protein